MKYKIYEVLGLAASGKSTTIESLQSEHENYVYYLNDTKLKFILIKHICLYLKLYYYSKRLDYVKMLISVHIFLYNIKEEKISKSDTYVFDQGVIYIISILIHEVPSLEKELLEVLDNILPYFNTIIYLEAPIDIICDRINNRGLNHRIKDKEKKIQIDFLNKHDNIYNRVLHYSENKGIHVVRIDTSVNSIKQVKRMVNEIIK